MLVIFWMEDRDGINETLEAAHLSNEVPFNLHLRMSAYVIFEYLKIGVRDCRVLADFPRVVDMSHSRLWRKAITLCIYYI
jgi:hypothetical protein